ncbi:MAG: sulfatase-like hydrolase/transferase, partial [Lentisphaerae bacterium]|nr:sulfatase-like hydrolase/transferase [Lentisphaerota bacterium]
MEKWMICLLLVAANVTFAGQAKEKPNVLFIISDDQGYGDFGFMGNTVLRTPQLDKLAASAAVFRNYTTGVACSPGRAMLFTGRNHLSTGVWGVGARFGLRRDETLMPMFFRENGYSTFYLGKGDCVAPHRMSPHHSGWQESLFVGGYQHHNGRLYHTPLAPLYSIKPVDVEGWTSEFMTERGIQFMKEKKGTPWLLSMAYIIPHTPWKPVDERYAPYYRKKGCSENIAACFSHIEQMDRCVGQLMDALKETGQDENTIVIFVSDNGQTGPSVKKPGAVAGWIDHPDWALRNVAGLRGNKSTAWENGTRVPLLVRMPGTIPAGMRKQFVTAEDVLPTLLDVAGISPDSVAHKPLSGVSMRPALLDETAKTEHPEVFRITSWG